MTGVHSHPTGMQGGTRRPVTDEDPFDAASRDEAARDEAALARFLAVSRRYLFEAQLAHDDRGRVCVVFHDTPRSG